MFVVKYYFFSVLGRGYVLRVIVFFVVGRFIDDVIILFMDIRLNGVEMFCVGIGNFYSKL